MDCYNLLSNRSAKMWLPYLRRKGKGGSAGTVRKNGRDRHAAVDSSSASMSIYRNPAPTFYPTPQTIEGLAKYSFQTLEEKSCTKK